MNREDNDKAYLTVCYLKEGNLEAYDEFGEQ